MADDEMPPPIRLVNFVSEDQLAESRKTRGARVEDGTAQRDRPLYEVLRENKDKKDAEFNERFKHRPPKALDEDETEFLERLEMSRRDYERQIADEEEQYLRSFQAAVASQQNVVHELKETPSVAINQEGCRSGILLLTGLKPLKLLHDEDNNSVVGRKNPPSRPLGMVIKVKPQAKKAKVETADPEETRSEAGGSVKTDWVSEEIQTSGGVSSCVVKSGLVSYSDDESEDDD